MLDQTFIADTRLQAQRLAVSVALLEDAVRCGDLEQIAVHLSAGISPNSRTTSYGDLVATAVFEQQIGSLSALLTAGGAPDSTDVSGVSALARAASYGRIDIVQLLLAHGVSLSQQDDHPFNDPAWAAAFSGQASMLLFCLSRVLLSI